MGIQQVLKDEDIQTTWTKASASTGPDLSADPDTKDADGTDGTDSPGTDTDGTDKDSDGTDS